MSKRHRPPRPSPQQRKPPGKAVARKPRKPVEAPPGIFGFHPKPDAMRLLEFVEEGGIRGTLALDREFAALHKASTGINPAMRRRSTFKDVKSGWYVEVAPEDAERTAALLAGTEFDPAFAFAPEGDAVGEPEFFADPRWCPACKAETPPRIERCPTCGGGTVDILHKGKGAEDPRSFWALMAVGLVVAALAVARLLR